jgi:heme-degrading monooxygenase HmoA
MHARIAQFDIVDGKVDDLAAAYASTMPLLRQAKGFRETILMIDRAAQKAVSVSLWDSEADIRATEKPGSFLEKALPIVAKFQKARPQFTIAEVVVRERD